MEKKIEEFTESELAYELAKRVGIPEPIDKEYEKAIFKDLKGTDGLLGYLKAVAAMDKDRYFAATTDFERAVIRGHFSLAAYLAARIKNAGELGIEKITKVEGVKYD